MGMGHQAPPRGPGSGQPPGQGPDARPQPGAVGGGDKPEKGRDPLDLGAGFDSDERNAVMLGYMGFASLFIAPFLAHFALAKTDKVRMHTKQALILTVIVLPLMLVLGGIAFIVDLLGVRILSTIVGFVFAPLVGLIFLGYAAASVMAMMKALEGKVWKMPLAGKFLKDRESKVPGSQ